MAMPWEQEWNDVPKGGRPDESKEGGILPWLKSWVGSPESKSNRDTGIKPITKSTDSLFERLIQAESGGRHTDEKGRLVTSPVGAEGITQLMPDTARKPGFGIEPAKDKSEEEYRRVGKQYLEALLGEFKGDEAKALAAYNAGIGNVRKAVEKGVDKWKDFLPKKEETLPYINKILGKANG